MSFLTSDLSGIKTSQTFEQTAFKLKLIKKFTIIITLLFIICALNLPSIVSFGVSAEDGITRTSAASKRGLVAHYSFEDSANLGKDSSGNNNHLKQVNKNATSGIKQGLGVVGKAAEFNGSSILAAVTASANGSDDFTDQFGDVTIDLWVRHKAGDHRTARLVSSGMEFEKGGFMLATTRSARSDYIHPAASNSSKINPVTGAPISDNWSYSKYVTDDGFSYNRWNHISMTVENYGAEKAGAITLYVNGAVYNTTYFEAGAFELGNPNMVFSLGGGLFGESLFDSFVGAMDEVKVYSRALSSDEIGDIHADELGDRSKEAGKDYWHLNDMIAYYNFENASDIGKDVSGYGNHIYVKGQGKVTQTEGKIGKAAQFNGTGFLSAPAFKGSNQDNLLDFSDHLVSATVAYWVRADGDTAGSVVSSGSRASQFGFNHYFSKSLQTGYRDLISKYSYINYEKRLSDSKLVNSVKADSEEWWHYAVSYDFEKQLISLFVNGKKTDSIKVSGFIALENYLGVFSIGGNSAATGAVENLFKGAVDDVRVYSYPLADAQVKNLFDYGNSPSPINPTDPIDPANPVEPTDPKLPITPPDPVSPPPTEIIGRFVSYPFDLTAIASRAFKMKAGFKEAVNGGEIPGIINPSDPLAAEYKNLFVATSVGGGILLLTVVAQLVLYFSISGIKGSASASAKSDKGGGVDE